MRDPVGALGANTLEIRHQAARSRNIEIGRLAPVKADGHGAGSGRGVTPSVGSDCGCE